MVVPLDGSALAERILPHVEDLAARTGAKVTLVRAWTPPVETNPIAPAAVMTRMTFNRGATPEARDAHYEAEHYLETTVDALRRRGVDADYELLEGPPGEMIVDEAEGIGAKMIAMSTHGRGGLGRVVLGSVADYVLRHASCPVLLVRAA